MLIDLINLINLPILKVIILIVIKLLDINKKMFYNFKILNKTNLGREEKCKMKQ